MNRPVRSTNMGYIAQALLVGSNLTLAGAVWFQIHRQDMGGITHVPDSGSTTLVETFSGSGESPTSQVELQKSIAALTATMQGFNTTLVQYDYLQREVARLREVDQQLGLRLREIHSAHQANPTEKTQQAFDLITANQDKIREEIDTRRESLQKLLGQLERKQGVGLRTPQPNGANPGNRPAASANAPPRSNTPSPATPATSNETQSPQ